MGNEFIERIEVFDPNDNKLIKLRMIKIEAFMTADGTAGLMVGINQDFKEACEKFPNETLKGKRFLNYLLEVLEAGGLMREAERLKILDNIGGYDG